MNLDDLLVNSPATTPATESQQRNPELQHHDVTSGAPLPRTSRKKATLTVTLVLATLLLLVSIFVTATITDRGRQATPLDPSSFEPQGTHAIANILRQQNIKINVTRNIQATTAALAATPNATLVVSGDMISSDNLKKLAQRSHDHNVVLLVPLEHHLEAFNVPAQIASATAQPQSAACPTNLTIFTRRTEGLNATAPQATQCLPLADSGFAYVVAGRTTAVAASDIFTNGYLATADNAAVSLRILGASPNLIWYLPTLPDLETGVQPTGLASMPTSYFAGIAGVGLVGLIALAAYARRFGPLVIEPLPVQVPALETALGRAKLYRASGDFNHIAGVLRHATLSRVHRRLAITVNDAERSTIVAIAERTSYQPAWIIQTLGFASATPIQTEAQLLQLAHDLAALEERISG